MTLRLSELAGKEIVNLHDGTRLGAIGDSDLVIDGTTGEVESIVLPSRGNMVSFWSERQPLIIPWQSIVKVGSEVIIVDLDHSHYRYGKFSI